MANDERQPDESGSKPVEADKPKSRRALSSVTRELKDEELSSTGVQKMLLESLLIAEEEITGLKSFREQYYIADKKNGIFREKLKIRVAAELISGGCLAVGACAIGFVPSVWTSQPTGGMILGFGLVLICVGIVAKVVTNNED